MTREKRTVTRGEAHSDILDSCQLMQHPKLVLFINVRNEFFMLTRRFCCLPHTPLFYLGLQDARRPVYIEDTSWVKTDCHAVALFAASSYRSFAFVFSRGVVVGLGYEDRRFTPLKHLLRVCLCVLCAVRKTQWQDSSHSTTTIPGSMEPDIVSRLVSKPLEAPGSVLQCRERFMRFTYSWITFYISLRRTISCTSMLKKRDEMPYQRAPAK